MARVSDLKGKQAGWKRLEYKEVSSLGITIHFDYENLAESRVRTTSTDDGYNTFKVDYNEMEWINKQIDAALEMEARSIRLTLDFSGERLIKRCSIRD